MKFGSITTPIVTDGLVLNADAANRASTIPSDSTTKVYNTVDTSIEGTFQDNAQFTTSGSINTWEFDGVDEWIDFGDVLDLGTNSMTVGVWVKPENNSNYSYLFSKAKAASQNYRFGFALWNNNPPYVYSFMQGNGGADIIPRTSSTFAFSNWYYIVCVWDRSSDIKININGVNQSLVGTSTISQWDGLNFQSSNPLRVGSYTTANNTDAIYPIKGSISALHVYHRVLSASEILHNYNALKGRFNL